MDLEHLQDKIDELKIELEEKKKTIRDDLIVDNKILDKCLAGQINLQIEWEFLSSKISWLYKVSDSLADEAYAVAFKSAMKDRTRMLSSTECKYWANCDADFIKADAIRNEAYGLRKQIEGILRTVVGRAFVLKDLAALVIDGSNKHIV